MAYAGIPMKMNGNANKDPFENESLNVNEYLVEITLQINLRDEDLSVISDLKVDSILKEHFSPFSNIVDYKVVEKKNLTKKYIYMNINMNMAFVYSDDSGNHYIKKEGRFDKVNLVNVDEKVFVDDFNLFRCVEFNAENYKKMYKSDVDRWGVCDAGPVNFNRDILSKPLDKPT